LRQETGEATIKCLWLFIFRSSTPTKKASSNRTKPARHRAPPKFGETLNPSLRSWNGKDDSENLFGSNLKFRTKHFLVPGTEGYGARGLDELNQVILRPLMVIPTKPQNHSRKRQDSNPYTIHFDFREVASQRIIMGNLKSKSVCWVGFLQGA
jgi:hypothetical protein